MKLLHPLAGLVLVASAGCALPPPSEMDAAPSAGGRAAAEGRVEREPAPRSRFAVVGRGPVTWTRTTGVAALRAANGRAFAYTGTSGDCAGCRGNLVYVWDVTDPARPTLTDSVAVDASTVAQVVINQAGTVAAVTREGAQSRRNGLLLLDLADPAHPRVIAEYFETLLGGARDAVWDGSMIYAVDVGTDEMAVLDASDPANVREVGRWGLPDSPDKLLRRVTVKDGLAYLAYWNDGVVVLDVGNGVREGTPRRPKLVSRHEYRTEWRGQRYGNTHHAVPYTRADGRRFLFVADEIIPTFARGMNRRAVTAGYVHVLDMADPQRPREIGGYTPPDAGVHTLWIDGGTLYMAAHGAGVRAVDVSGELRGGLRGREIAALPTADERARVPGVPFAMSGTTAGGLVFATDANSGLWIARLELDTTR